MAIDSPLFPLSHISRSTESQADIVDVITPLSRSSVYPNTICFRPLPAPPLFIPCHSTGLISFFCPHARDTSSSSFITKGTHLISFPIHRNDNRRLLLSNHHPRICISTYNNNGQTTTHAFPFRLYTTSLYDIFSVSLVLTEEVFPSSLSSASSTLRFHFSLCFYSFSISNFS